MNQRWDSADPDEGIYVEPVPCADIARAERKIENENQRHIQTERRQVD